MPTLPVSKTTIPGLLKVYPPTAVEGVISNPLLTVYWAPTSQLYFVGEEWTSAIWFEPKYPEFFNPGVLFY